jgi:hypothetical protein
MAHRVPLVGRRLQTFARSWTGIGGNPYCGTIPEYPLVPNFIDASHARETSASGTARSVADEN